MKTELVPAVVAAVGGSAMLGIIVVGEARAEARMRASRLPYRMTFPVGVDAESTRRALVAVSGWRSSLEVVAEVGSRGEDVTHRLHLPAASADALGTQLRAAVPGLRLTAEETNKEEEPRLSRAVVVPSRAVLRTDDPAGGARQLLAALLPLRRDEAIRLRWALRPGTPSQPTEPTDEDRAWCAKLSEPGLYVAGVLDIWASDRGRASALATQVEAVLRARRGARGGVHLRHVRPGSSPRSSRRSGWLTAAEVVALTGWPVGSEAIPGVELGAARQIAPARSLARSGRPLLLADDHGTSRPVALSTEAARHHLAVLGPTGCGKSTVLARGVLSDMAAGYGGVVIDPRGDLLSDIVARIPARHAHRVCVIDPNDPGPVPGVDLLGGGDPDLRADVLLGVFRELFTAWGPRTDVYVRLGSRTLAEVPGASLADWPALFLDPALRRSAVGHVHDPMLRAQWRAFEALSEAEKVQHIAAPMSRVMSLVGRPAVRAVLAQPNPRLDVARLLDERRWLLVSLSRGVLGAPAARLIGAVVTHVVWSAITARASLPPERRHPVFLYFDELQALTDQGVGLEDLLEQARALGCGINVGTQAVARLPESVRQALLTNAATVMSFRAAADEASRIARELPGLDASDLMALRPFEVAARVGLGTGAGRATVTGSTEPLPPSTGQAERVRQLSAERYGRDRAEIAEAIEARYSPTADVPDAPIGRVRRHP